MTWYNTYGAPNAYRQFMSKMFSDVILPGLPRLFLSFFGRPETGAITRFLPDNEHVTIDIIRGDEKRAHLVPRGGGSAGKLDKEAKLVRRFSTAQFGFPLLEEEGAIEVSQLFARAPGQDEYAQQTRQMHLRGLAVQDHEEKIRMFIRAMEYMAMKSIVYGKMPKNDLGETTPLYDWSRAAGNSFTAAADWATASTDIAGDLQTAAGLVRTNGHMKADVALMDPESVEAVLGNTALKAVGDNRRINQFAIYPDDSNAPKKIQWLLDAGADYRGMLVTPAGHKLSLLSYNEEYTSDAGSATKYFPADTCLVFASDARCDEFYGPGERLPVTPTEERMFQERFGLSQKMVRNPGNPGAKSTGILDSRKFMFDSYDAPNKKAVMVRTQAAPIFVPTVVDAFVKIDTSGP